MPSTHRIPGLVLKDHQFMAPLDYDHPGGPQISVFSRLYDMLHGEV